MLRNVGVVAKGNMIRIDRWDIDTGMVHNDVSTVWESIEEQLYRGQIVAAIAELRRWAEAFYKHVCHNLRAAVPYSIDGRWSLSDFRGPGQSKYKKLLSRAISKSLKIDNSSLHEQLVQLEIKLVDAYEAIETESWLINWTLHDNEGAIPAPDEVRRAVQAFQWLYDLLHCDKCMHMIRLADRAGVVSCKCGKILWKV